MSREARVFVSSSVPDPREAERIVLAEITRCVELRIEMTGNEDLAQLLGDAALSTPPAILNRLERRGVIRVKRYQRSRQIIDLATGMATAEPSNTAPHWRDRPRNIPSVSIHKVAQKKPDVAMWIQSEARRLGKLPSDFIADLVYIGAVQYQAEQALEPA